MTYASIRKVLEDFNEFSDLHINKVKSFIVFTKSVPNVEHLASQLDLPAKTLPFQHLGIPLIGKGIKHADYSKLICSLQAILL